MMYMPCGRVYTLDTVDNVFMKILGSYRVIWYLCRYC